MNMATEIGRPLEAIHRHLIEQHGLDLSRYKESYLKRRLLVRMRALRLQGIEAYARYLRRHPEELGRLLARRLSGKELVLVKASRGVQLEKAIPHILPAN